MQRYRHRVIVRGQRGQVMIVFALVSVVLFALIGLAIDAGMSYLASDQVERAAQAAALAGVAYLPQDQISAQNAAFVEAARNGFTAQDTATADTCSDTYPCVVTSFPTSNELKVTISVTVPTTFLKLLGFASTLVTRFATAEFLPPIALGQPGTQQGSTLAQLGTGDNYYIERTEGWGNPRSEGDAFTPSPDQNNTDCGPLAAYSCEDTSQPDVQEISYINRTEASPGSYSPAVLNSTGGYSYLITLAPQQSVDVQVYNPAFAPDTATDANNSTYTYHEDDGSFPQDGTAQAAGTQTAATETESEYSAMAYSLFTVGTLASDLNDKLVSQEIFYPYNATCIDPNNTTHQYSDAGTMTACPGSDIFYFSPPNLSTGSWTKVTDTPATYHQWVSAIDYTPAAGTDTTLFHDTVALGNAHITNTNPVGGPNMYWRLEVDTLTANGQATCTGTTCTDPNTANLPDASSTAHKGYAVRVLPASGSCTTTTACSISAMDDMTVYTPIINNTGAAEEFTIPLFQLDQSYAGTTIDIDIFDIGDLATNNPAWVGIQEPDGVTWAPATSMVDRGDYLSSTLNLNVSANWNGTDETNLCSGPANCATFQTAYASNGNAIYNGQWVQLQVQVPSTFGVPANCGGATNCWSKYWNLVYEVSAGATSGDTFSVQVGYAGSPDHLLP